MNKNQFSGCGTALVTPFRSKGELDRDAFRGLIEWQLAEGIDFLVPCGTTGESVTLSRQEYAEVVALCVETVGGRIPVVAGAGSNSTAAAQELARLAEKAGADAILSVGPYYNKPTNSGFLAHFKGVADSVSIPVVIYNVPGRTGSNIEAAVVSELSRDERFAGVKEASGNLSQIMEVAAGSAGGFQVLSGDDPLALATIAVGGDGLISVASNLIPGPLSRMVRLARQGSFEEARKIHYRFLRLMHLNFIESNPIPVKFALAEMGRIEERYRLPLCPLEEKNRAVVRSELKRLELV